MSPIAVSSAPVSPAPVDNPIRLCDTVFMGEAKVKVKLTNAVDESMARRGLLSPDKVRWVELEAEVDTGAVRCCIPPHVRDRLGLGTFRRTSARSADGRLEEVELTEPASIEMLDRATQEGCLVLGDEVLIGQTALETTDLLVDCTHRCVIPNPAHPNAPVTMVRSAAAQ